MQQQYIVFTEEGRAGLPPGQPHLVHIDHRTTEEHSHIMHSHSGIVEILLICQGHGMYCLDGRRFAISEGDVVICNSGQVHDELIYHDMPYETLCIGVTNIRHGDLRENCLLPPGASPVFHRPAQFDELCALLYMINHHAAADTALDAQLCQQLMLAAVLLAGQMAGEGVAAQDTAGAPLCTRVKEYIAEHYAEALTLEALGARFRVSPYHLAHVFKRETGYSVRQYILRRRIGEAQSLLMNTRENVTRIAEATGFDGPGHLDKLFRKYVGMSPTAYRIYRAEKQ